MGLKEYQASKTPTRPFQPSAFEDAEVARRQWKTARKRARQLLRAAGGVVGPSR